MRTHLLRTVYASSAIEATASDTGNAANDASYARAPTPATPITTRTPPLSRAPAAEDDYVLGGYAGI